MEEQEKLSMAWVNELMSISKNDDRVEGLRLDVNQEKSGVIELKFIQGNEVIHKAVYPDRPTLERSFPATLLFIISEGIKEFHNKRKKR